MLVIERLLADGHGFVVDGLRLSGASRRLWAQCHRAPAGTRTDAAPGEIGLSAGRRGDRDRRDRHCHTGLAYALRARLSTRRTRAVGRHGAGRDRPDSAGRTSAASQAGQSRWPLPSGEWAATKAGARRHRFSTSVQLASTRGRAHEVRRSEAAELSRLPGHRATRSRMD
jgi:hypothetical protein